MYLICKETIISHTLNFVPIHKWKSLPSLSIDTKRIPLGCRMDSPNIPIILTCMYSLRLCLYDCIFRNVYQTYVWFPLLGINYTKIFGFSFFIICFIGHVLYNF